MTYEEAIRESDELKAHLNKGAFSVQEQDRIVHLYKEVLDKEFKKTSCRRCYHDALIEVVVYLRKEGRMRPRSNYALRAGFIIHCTTFHGGKIFTNMNLSDEVAEEYLSLFPDKRVMFSRLPEVEPKKEEAESAPVNAEPRKPKSKKKKK